MEEESGGSGCKRGCPGHEKASRCAWLPSRRFYDLFLAWHKIAHPGEVFDQPLMSVEGAGRAKALLKPGNRVFTDKERLFDYQAQKSAERSDDD